MPTPAVFKDERLDLVSALPAELRTTRLPVFYATTRAPIPVGEPGHYANRQGDGVTLGVADVRLGEPGWTWSDLAASDRTNTIEQERPGAVERIQEFGKIDAIARRARPSAASSRRSTRSSRRRETTSSCSTCTATA